MAILQGLKDWVIGKTQVPSCPDSNKPLEQTTMNDLNMDTTTVQVVENKKKRTRERWSNTSKTSGMTRVSKKRRRMGPNISDENLDNEIRALEKRLYYYRARKKGLTDKKTWVNRNKADAADYAFYIYWTKKHDFASNYKRLYAQMINNSKKFVEFQNRLRHVFNKRATPEQMETLTALIKETTLDIEQQ